MAAVIAVSACSSDDDMAGDEGLVTDRIEITDDPLMGTEVGLDSTPLDGPTPGTQADLVVSVGDRVFFGYDQHNLTDEARTTLENQASWLQQYPSVNITIEGHADERGTREYNLALGERRSTAVKNYLIALGVEPFRIRTISFGKERPAVPGSNPTAWAQNRRGVSVVE